MKQIAKLQEKFDETEEECKQLKVTIAEMEETNVKMRESYDQTIHVSLKSNVTVLHIVYNALRKLC